MEAATPFSPNISRFRPLQNQHAMTMSWHSGPSWRQIRQIRQLWQLSAVQPFCSSTWTLAMLKNAAGKVVLFWGKSNACSERTCFLGILCEFERRVMESDCEALFERLFGITSPLRGYELGSVACWRIRCCARVLGKLKFQRPVQEIQEDQHFAVNPTSSWRFSPKVIAVIVPVSVDCPAENESTKCRVLAMLLQLAATIIVILCHIHTYSYDTISYYSQGSPFALMNSGWTPAISSGVQPLKHSTRRATKPWPNVFDISFLQDSQLFEAGFLADRVFWESCYVLLALRLSKAPAFGDQSIGISLKRYSAVLFQRSMHLRTCHSNPFQPVPWCLLQ